jgi:protein TonB
VAYPPAASGARVSGTVQVEAIVRKDGRLRNVRAVVGPLLLRQPTVNAVKGWRYVPAMLNGFPIEERVTIEVVFRPEDEGQYE